ncbi:hypothetical protein GPJ56_003689 [Histomonas meleagridis]|uniref:uncharacterized protein n=1 Tax=Histomonas meleagridis TaxID=135588 RepID=UPI00355995C3|nr:hypothetical protein GPJ56_003689 [Histomonas meleagridis]KAH0806226.1 hypothetical protein GO595_000914 [Histomonas meleagridis]
MEESALLSELKSFQEIPHEAKHRMNVSIQTINKIKNQIKLETENRDRDKTQIAQLNSEIMELQTLLDNKEEELQELIDQCNELQDEEIAITKSLKQYDEGYVEKLRSKLKKKQDELKSSQNLEKNLQKKYTKLLHQYQVNKSRQERQLKSVMSTSNWMNERSILLAKIAKSKDKFTKDKQNLNSTLQRKQVIQRKFKSLLGEDDPGNGTGERVKQMVLAELEERSNNVHDDNDLVEQMIIEENYNLQLNEELQKLQKSNELLDQHISEVLDSLNDELQECSQNGYLKLLKCEMNKLQATLSKVR